MDARLYEAAITGNHSLLSGFSQDALDKAILSCVGKDNPLHIGALFGHVDFVRAILSRKPHLARELNSQGQSPLHLAAAKGHVDVVKAILERDADVCYVQDGDGRTPLHIAAIKGQIEALKEMIQAKAIAARTLTSAGEPLLHLCVNHNHFVAVKLLFEFAVDNELLNLKDYDNNTILHLLAAKKQYKVIKFVVDNARVDINATNTHGFTALDVSIEYSSGFDSWRTRWILIGAGAKTSMEIFHKRPYQRTKKMLSNKYRIWYIQVLLVVAILMTTVAFQTGLNPPGGVWQDTGYHNSTSPNAPHSYPQELVHHFAGQSVMSSMNPKYYRIFSTFNSVTLLSSMLLIILLVSGFPLNETLSMCSLVILTGISVQSMLVTYIFSSSFLSSVEFNSTSFWITIPFSLLGLVSMIRASAMLIFPFYVHVYFFRFIWFLKINK